jgi:cytochrome c oxidase assembly protein subunit 11
MTNKKNLSLVINLLMIVVGMSMLTYASVPLYRLFCSMTGFGGATKEAKALPDRISSRTITVRFNADIDQNLPWDFKASQLEIPIRAGERALAFYTAENTATTATTGHATYNVVPNKAGMYFNKIECFCFKNQTLQAGQKVNMPVSFFIDPDIDSDPNMADVTTITLSYTFFKAKE